MSKPSAQEMARKFRQRDERRASRVITTDKIKVRETIHHGDYYNVREVEIKPTWDGFVELLSGSPYAAGNDASTLASNRYAAKTFADIINRGRGERGWALYEVI
jgi:hypothetical protein